MKTKTIQFACRLCWRVSVAMLLVGWSRLVAAEPEAPRELLVYSENFEGGNGGYVVLGKTSWEWGVTTKLPPNPRGGELAWATGLIGNYGPNENGAILSPVIDLSRQPVGSSFRLNWYQFLVTESAFDRASVEASRDGGASWTRIYGEASGEAARTWVRQSVSLSQDWAVAGFRLRFRFRSDDSRAELGFAVDDIELVRVRNDFPEVTFNSGGGHRQSADATVALDSTFGSWVASPGGVPLLKDGIRVVPGFLPMFEFGIVDPPPIPVPPVIRRIQRNPNGDLLLSFAKLQQGFLYQLESSADLRGTWAKEARTFMADSGSETAQIEVPLGGKSALYFRVVQVME
jgi:hypothetical protein